MSAEDIFALNAALTTQKSIIKQMKKDGKLDTLKEEVAKLEQLRASIAEIEKALAPPVDPFNRKAYDELLLRKMYLVPSFEIHNGPAGFFDYGPVACTLKANVINRWRQHFVVEESMLEMECTNLTPSVVLETSGHVERFTDFMVRDDKTNECFRADKLLEDAIDAFLLKAGITMPAEEQEAHRIIQRQADCYSAKELHAMLVKYDVKSPTNPENGLTEPFPFNLMFQTTIGPEGTNVGYLRPETAQGLFVNFRRLLEFNQQKMPFAAAQVGLGFRNEIAPRNGLLRVREFCMGEIEHFVHPDDKSHPRFKSISSKELVLFSSDAQLSTGRTTTMTVGEAVFAKLINNETLGYFMTRTQMWLEDIGVNPAKMRFRQHLPTEMAHYATDCWDMEIQLSSGGGWMECVGHADRSCFDLTQHADKTGVPLLASIRLAEPLTVDSFTAEANKKKIGPKFKGEQKAVIAALESLDEENTLVLQQALAASADDTATIPQTVFVIHKDMVTFISQKKTIWETKFTPSVIEPSFGMGRVMTAVLEHAFSQREADEQRCVMKFRPSIAPIKVGIFRLIKNVQFDSIVEDIRVLLHAKHIVTKVDSNAGTVGRRYSRADELGIPFGITVDFQTLLDEAVTVRDRDSMCQIRVPLNRLVDLLEKLISEQVSWSFVMTRFPVVKTGDEEEGEEGTQAKAASASTEVVKTVLEHTTRATFSRPAIPITRP